MERNAAAEDSLIQRASDEALSLRETLFGLRDSNVSDSADDELRILSAVLRNVDICEVYSPKRVAEVCGKYGLTAGDSFDLVTGWDLSDRRQQQRARDLIRSQSPRLLICSPPCTKFSSLQNLNVYVLGPEWEAEFKI